MPSILNLKFKGNKSFVAFSNLGDAESLTKTWKVCTKVASYLEQGQRLENLSWRLWHLQNLMVDTDNAKSKREFKKLSKCMGDKLDKEKGRSIEELSAPAFQRNPSTDLIRQRATEKERVREAHANTPDHIIQRMQFTFAVEPVSNSASTTSVTKNTTNTTTHAGAKRKLGEGTAVRLPTLFSNSFGPEALLATTQSSLAPRMNYGDAHLPYGSNSPGDMRISRPTIELPLDELLNADVDASDIEHEQDSSTNDEATNYNSDVPSVHPVQSWSWDELMRGGTFDPANGFGLTFPMFGPSPGPNDPSPLPLTLDPHAAFGPQPKHESLSAATPTHSSALRSPHLSPNAYFMSELEDDAMDGTSSISAILPPLRTVSAPVAATSSKKASHKNTSSVSAKRSSAAVDEDDSSDDGGDDSADSDFYDQSASSARARARPRSGTTGSRGRSTNNSAPRRPTASQTPTTSVPQTKRPVLSVRVPASARPPVQAPIPGVGANHTAPGGVKAECSNCGATHTPLWRRGLNDELNCNACGLYCKLHKRPRPKTMRNSGGGEGRGQSVRSETVDIMAAQCYNCHTTATPLWRKDDEGKTVCNACGLYYKLHGSARPISMKSDVIRKRSRHDARRGGAVASAETPTASPGVSRRASPAPGASSSSSGSAGRSSPVLSADTSPESSEAKPVRPRFVNPFSFHEAAFNDALPFASVDVAADADTSIRANKRRRMSVDSASEPPSSATSYSSYTDGYTSGVSSSQFSSEFPFSRFPNVGYNGDGGKQTTTTTTSSGTFWHHEQLHPPMLPSTSEESLEYLHPPMMVQESFFTNTGYLQNQSGLHPPMLPADNEVFGMLGAHPPMMPYDDIYEGGGMHY
ncbi:hypothetical protein MIND_00974300 [Mycena indigotica]|uniref:GATA-type domain-containing protein n=1 Tax=Mycena indigotica TaxID=2126181 RepID=A0A8H6VXF2_9AGAR|nr:uncharacterized protein MIND_00974300 [Mycena indigotica]KAF7297407.1 hypothetical protein MIND_00974300 [Mycena indigotica]